MSPLPASPTRRAGFSLAELMVGLALGMLTLLAMSSVFVAFHFQHRVIDSDIDAQTSAMNALYAIERDLLQAGQGLGDRRLLGCTARRDGGGNLLLVPAKIVSGSNGGPDTLRLLLGDSRSAPVKLVSALAPGAAAIAVGSTLGMRTGDALALQQDGRSCALVRVGAINSALLVGKTAENGAAPQAGTDAVDAAGYSSDAMAFNLGGLVEVSYAVAGGMLQRTRTAYPGAAGVTENIAAGIVSLRVQYGFDTRAGEPSRLEVDTWRETMMDADLSGTTGDRGDWQRIAGLRLAVVARSPFRQAVGACATTVAGAANAPRWRATTDGSEISLAHVPDWQCYRYQVAEAIVPLRNVIWGLP